MTYPHPSLVPILQRTLGVPLFQEQLLRMAMTAAGFTGTEAEELRRAFGFKRSEQRMAEVEVKLRAGMARQGITGEAAEQIVHAITAFALYGFPESHASSFALLAYASAYLKMRHPAAFYAALLNNQPMGFYHAATIVKDAQRHRLRIRPIDVTRSDWLCTVELLGGGLRPPSDASPQDSKAPAKPALERGDVAVRLGLRYVKGLRESVGRAIVAARTVRPFRSLDDLTRRAGLERDELTTLAAIGALNPLGGTRRATLWQVAVPTPPDLFVAPESAREVRAAATPPAGNAAPAHPLSEMNAVERLAADYTGTGVTLGPHPMALRRGELARRGVTRAADLAALPDGGPVRVAGSVIVRQRPGTAKGFVFLSLEDETGVANVIVTPRLFSRRRLTLVTAPFLLAEGILQTQDGVISVRARAVEALPSSGPPVPSHDFG